MPASSIEGMANAIRATMLGNRSPSRRSSQGMTNSGHGPSIFASITTEQDDEHEAQVEQEVRNINSFYSPLNISSSDSQAGESFISISSSYPAAVLIIPNAL